MSQEVLCSRSKNCL